MVGVLGGTCAGWEDGLDVRVGRGGWGRVKGDGKVENRWWGLGGWD